jgi:fatty-acyl-CoA synthase
VAAALSVLRALGAQARCVPGALAIVDAAGPITYGQLWDRVLRASSWLGRCGARPGDVVATSLAPGADHLAVLLGAMHRGCVAAPLNTRLTAAELDRYLSRIQPRLIIDELPSLEDHSRPSDAPAMGDAPALVIGTGGTTGVPKAAVFSHEAIGRWTLAAVGHQHLRRSTVEISATPFFHGFLVTGVLSVLLVGGTVRLLERFDAELALAEIEAHGVTRMSAPPTMLVAMASMLRDAGRTAGLRSVLFSSSEPPAGLVQQLVDVLPRVELMTGYGTTEFGPAVRLYLDEEAGELATGSVGRPIPTVDLVVLRPDGGLASPDEEGEVAVYTPWRMTGYYDDPSETTLIEAGDGRLRSGDLGTLSSDGLLVLKGRKKDLISTGGENVFPVEVESVLGLHPAVEAVAVYGARDPYWGERVEAAVVLRPGASVDLEGLRAFGRNELAGYKLPKSLQVLEALPITANSKVNRRALRDAAEHR